MLLAGVARGRFGLAKMLAKMGQVEQARVEAASARKTFEEIGEPKQNKKIDEFLQELPQS